MVSLSLFAFLGLAALAAAGPVQHGRTAENDATPTLPENGGASELPSPPSDLVLKVIALGHGVQNYTCPGDTTVAATSAGALAVLYDATHLFPGNGPDAANTIDEFEYLPVAVAWASALPLNLDNSSDNRVLANQPGARPGNAFLSHDPTITIDGKRLRPVGHHYFDNSGNPIFDLGDIGFLAGAVLDKIPAPKDAAPGPDGQTAVAWLHLDSVDAAGSSQDVTVAYRVTTVGGNSQGCTKAGGLSVPYAAFYWFYGPKE